MIYTERDILEFIENNDVKFIRMSFTDLRGNLKNVAIMADKFSSAYKNGVPVEKAVLEKNSSEICYLKPDLGTMAILPWRPQSGSVIRFFCNIYNEDGSLYNSDIRAVLKAYSGELKKEGWSIDTGTKCEFYLFKNDEYGNPTKHTADNGGYLDVAPLDACENVRREICLTLEEMGIRPKYSCHKRGPGQNQIDFVESNPLTAADNMMQYKSVVKAVASQHGYYASFMPKPLKNWDGSAFTINFNITKDGERIFGGEGESITGAGESFIAGILKYIKDITVFLNPTTNSYKRIGSFTAPKYASWSDTLSFPAILITRNIDKNSCISFRTADSSCNPYIAVYLLLKAGMRGIKENLTIQEKNEKIVLPSTLSEALSYAVDSDFVDSVLPCEIKAESRAHFERMLEEYELAKDKDKFEEDKFFSTI